MAQVARSRDDRRSRREAAMRTGNHLVLRDAHVGGGGVYVAATS